jgi:hypothetical protein
MLHLVQTRRHGLILAGLVALLIFCVSNVYAMPVSLESGWQEARIQAVRKARDVMNRDRERKRVAALEGVEAEVEHNPRKRMRRMRR